MLVEFRKEFAPNGTRSKAVRTSHLNSEKISISLPLMCIRLSLLSTRKIWITTEALHKETASIQKTSSTTYPLFQRQLTLLVAAFRAATEMPPPLSLLKGERRYQVRSQTPILIRLKRLVRCLE